MFSSISILKKKEEKKFPCSIIVFEQLVSIFSLVVLELNIGNVFII